MLSLAYRSPLRRSLFLSAIRYNSTVPAQARTRFASHLLAGFAGVIIGAGGAGYTWYYFSGLRKVVDRIQEASLYLDQARDNLSKGKPPSQTLWFLRRAVKSYLAFPGSNFIVDHIFDIVEVKIDAHADEANAFIASAYTQIRDIIQQDGGKFVTQHAVQILRVLQNLIKQLEFNGLELKQMTEKYEVERRVNDGLAAVTVLHDGIKETLQDSREKYEVDRRVNDGLAAVTALHDDIKAKIQDSGLFEKIGGAIRRKPVNDDASPDPLQPAADTTPLKSDDDGMSS